MGLSGVDGYIVAKFEVFAVLELQRAFIRDGARHGTEIYQPFNVCNGFSLFHSFFSVGVIMRLVSSSYSAVIASSTASSVKCLYSTVHSVII